MQSMSHLVLTRGVARLTSATLAYIASVIMKAKQHSSSMRLHRIYIILSDSITCMCIMYTRSLEMMFHHQLLQALNERQAD